MLGIIIVGHGSFAKGLKESAEMILGRQAFCESVGLMPDMKLDAFSKNLRLASKRVSSSGSIIVLCDLVGGTPYSQSLEVFTDNVLVIGGVNLAILLEVLTNRAMPLNTLKEYLREQFSLSFKGVLRQADEGLRHSANENRRQAHTIIRVDDRLIHSQLIAGWLKPYGIRAVLVVDNESAEDPIQGTLLKLNGDEATDVAIISVHDFINGCNDLIEQYKMILFRTIEDLYECIQRGVPIQLVNIGGIRSGNRQISSTVRINKEQEKILRDLLSKDIQIDIQLVPGDIKIPIRDKIDN